MHEEEQQVEVVQFRLVKPDNVAPPRGECVVEHNDGLGRALWTDENGDTKELFTKTADQYLAEHSEKKQVKIRKFYRALRHVGAESATTACAS